MSAASTCKNVKVQRELKRPISTKYTKQKNHDLKTNIATRLKETTACALTKSITISDTYFKCHNAKPTLSNCKKISYPNYLQVVRSFIAAIAFVDFTDPVWSEHKDKLARPWVHIKTNAGIIINKNETKIKVLPFYWKAEKQPSPKTKPGVCKAPWIQYINLGGQSR